MWSPMLKRPTRVGIVADGTSASHITRPFNPDNATRWPAVYGGLPWLVPGYGGALLWVYDLSLVRLAVG